MRWIAMLLALMVMGTGCTMIEENASLRKENERLQKQVTAAEMRAGQAQRDLAYARKHPETLRVSPSPSVAAKPAAKPAAATARPASARAGKGHIVIGDSDVSAEAKAAALDEVTRLNAMIASIKSDYDVLGADSDKYTNDYNDLLNAIDKCRTTLALYDQVVAPALDAMPPAPGAAAQARYDAARAEETHRAEEAKRTEEEAAQKREADKTAQTNREATAKVAADAAVKALEKNAPPPVMVVPGVVRTPAPTPSGSKMQ